LKAYALFKRDEVNKLMEKEGLKYREAEKQAIDIWNDKSKKLEEKYHDLELRE
jgi:hypothetical protein